MSRRYGRNQKRKAQALLTATIQKSELQQKLHEAKTAQLELRVAKVEAGYKTILELIENTLGPYSLLRVLATGKTRAIHSGLPDPDGSPIKVMDDPEPMRSPWACSGFSAESLNVHELYSLISNFQRDFKDQYVAEVSYRSGIHCLALNPNAFKSAPKAMLIGRIAGDMLAHLRKRT